VSLIVVGAPLKTRMMEKCVLSLVNYELSSSRIEEKRVLQKNP
jgi:hypothetical protein